MKTLFLLFVMVVVMVSSSWGQNPQINLNVTINQQFDYEVFSPHPGTSLWTNKGGVVEGLARTKCYSGDGTVYCDRDFDTDPEQTIEFVMGAQTGLPVKFTLQLTQIYEQGNPVAWSQFNLIERTP